LNDEIDSTEYFLEGLDVDTDDYKYWEASILAASGDYPVIYNPDHQSQASALARIHQRGPIIFSAFAVNP